MHVAAAAGMFRSLRVRNYRFYAGGQVISLTGTWMQRVAQDWLILELSGNSGTAIGFVLALQFGPTLLFSLFGGVLADRYDKRRILFVTQSIMIVQAAVLGVLDVSGAVQLWHVYLLALVLGVTSAIDVPVRQSFVVEMVGGTDLPNAVSLNSVTFNLARIVGPALAGVLIAVVGTGWVFLGNAVFTRRGDRRAGADAAGRAVPVAADRSLARPAEGGPALRQGPPGPDPADGAGLRRRHVRAQLPGHDGAAGQGGLRPRRRRVRPVHHRDRGRLAGRRADVDPALRGAADPAAAHRLLRLRRERDGGRPGADVLVRGRAAAADGCGRPDVHDRGELDRAAGQRPGLPRPGDGALPDVLHGRHADRRPAGRRDLGRVRAAGRGDHRRRDLGAGRSRRRRGGLPPARSGAA